MVEWHLYFYLPVGLPERIPSAAAPGRLATSPLPVESRSHSSLHSADRLRQSSLCAACQSVNDTGPPPLADSCSLAPRFVVCNNKNNCLVKTIAVLNRSYLRCSLRSYTKTLHNDSIYVCKWSVCDEFQNTIITFCLSSFVKFWLSALEGFTFIFTSLKFDMCLKDFTTFSEPIIPLVSSG